MKKRIGAICLCLIMFLEIVMNFPLEEVRAADLTPVHSGTICLFVGEKFTATMDTSKPHYLLNGATSKTYDDFSVELSGTNNSKITITATKATGGTPSNVRIYDAKSNPTKEYYAIAVAVLAAPPTPTVTTPPANCWRGGNVGFSASVSPKYSPQKCKKSSNCSCIIGNISGWTCSYSWRATNCSLSSTSGATCNAVSSSVGQASVALTATCKSNNTTGVVKTATTVIRQWNVYEKPAFATTPEQDVYIWRGEKRNIKINAAATIGVTVTNKLSGGDLAGATAVYSNGYLVVDTANCQKETNFTEEVCLTSTAGGSVATAKSNIQIHVCDKPKIDSWEVAGETNKASVVIYENDSINVTMHASGSVTDYVWNLSDATAFSCIEQNDTNTLKALKEGQYRLVMQAQANSYKAGLADCASEDKSIDIQVLKAPKITEMPSAVHLWENGSTTVSMTYEGNVTEIDWEIQGDEHNLVSLSGTDTSQVRISAGVCEDNTRVTLVGKVSSSGNREHSVSIPVNIYKKPVITSGAVKDKSGNSTQTNELYLFKGESATLLVNGKGKITDYEWKIDSINGDVANLEVDNSECNITAKKEGTCVVKVKAVAKNNQSIGLVDAESSEYEFTVTVVEVPQIIYEGSENVYIWNGKTKDIEIQTAGDVANINWEIDDATVKDVVLRNNNNKKVTIDASATEGSSVFNVTVTVRSRNVNGIIKEDSKQVTVHLMKKPVVDEILRINDNNGLSCGDTIYLYKGQSVTLQMKTTGQCDSMEWSSDSGSNFDKVQDNDRCTITPNRVGVFTIYAQAFGGDVELGLESVGSEKKELKVVVFEKPGVYISDDEHNRVTEVTIYDNEEKELYYNYVDVNNSTVKNIEVVSSDDNKVSACYDKDKNCILLVGKSKSETVIQVSVKVYVESIVAVDNETVCFETILSVNEAGSNSIPVQKISFDKSDQTITLEEGDNTRRIKAIISPADATVQNVIYSSSDSSIVTVDSTGKLTAVGAGMATITAKSADKMDISATSTIYVKKKKPTNVSIKDVNGMPVISWSGVDGGNTYSIWRKDGYASYKKIGDTRTLQYTDTSAKYGVNYTYAVKTVWDENNDFDSELSDVVAYKRVLSSPQNVVTANKSKYVEISWKKAANATSYKIYRSTIKNGEYVAIGKTDTNKYCDTKAVYGKKYYYKVTAIIGNDESVRSSAVLADYKPSKPSVKSISAKNGTMKISMKKAYYDGCSVYVGKSKKNKKYVGSFTKKAATIRYSRYKGKYSVWIRTYKKVNGKKVYSDYSKPKKVKFK